MKKHIAALLVLLLILALASCGRPSGNGPTEPVTEESVTEEAPTGEQTTEEPDDETLVAELTEKLIGTWGYPGDGKTDDLERLTFNADGSGTYRGLPGGLDCDLTYAVHIDHRTYNNGTPYVEYMLEMKYGGGEEEDVIFFFTEQGKLAFHDGDNSGYNGVMDNLDVLTKEE